MSKSQMCLGLRETTTGQSSQHINDNGDVQARPEMVLPFTSLSVIGEAQPSEFFNFYIFGGSIGSYFS